MTTPTTAFKEELKKLIEKDKSHIAVQKIKATLSISSEKRSGIYSIEIQLNELNRSYRNGFINDQTFQIRSAKIINRILEFISDLKAEDLFFEEKKQENFEAPSTETVKPKTKKGSHRIQLLTILFLLILFFTDGINLWEKVTSLGIAAITIHTIFPINDDNCEERIQIITEEIIKHYKDKDLRNTGSSLDYCKENLRKIMLTGIEITYDSIFIALKDTHKKDLIENQKIIFNRFVKQCLDGRITDDDCWTKKTKTTMYLLDFIDDLNCSDFKLKYCCNL